jgi:hypothetical protein
MMIIICSVYLLLLNDTMDVISCTWVELMVFYNTTEGWNLLGLLISPAIFNTLRLLQIKVRTISNYSFNASVCFEIRSQESLARRFRRRADLTTAG